MWALDLVSFQLPHEGEMKRQGKRLKRHYISHFTYSTKRIGEEVEFMRGEVKVLRERNQQKAQFPRLKPYSSVTIFEIRLTHTSGRKYNI